MRRSSLISSAGEGLSFLYGYRAWAAGELENARVHFSRALSENPLSADSLLGLDACTHHHHHHHSRADQRSLLERMASERILAGFGALRKRFGVEIYSSYEPLEGFEERLEIEDDLFRALALKRLGQGRSSAAHALLSRTRPSMLTDAVRARVLLGEGDADRARELLAGLDPDDEMRPAVDALGRQIASALAGR